MGRFLTADAFRTDWSRIPDLKKFPELRWLDRYDTAVPVALAMLLYGLGAWLGHVAPRLRTSGAQMPVWGFFISTVVLFHATVTINSLAHGFGRRRFDTQDDSRSNVWLALTYGKASAPLWFQRWRMFWMACAELFGYEQGSQWQVAHYRFVRPD